MRVSILGALLACAMQAMSVEPALADMPDSNTYYRLSTEFRGTNLSLDVFNGGDKNNLTHLAPTGSFTGQLWHFTPQGDGTYRLTTKFRGEKACLDIFNGGPNDNQPHLTDCGNFTGQKWIVVEEGKWIRLKTRFRGNGMCLDISNGGPNNDQPHFTPCGNFSGQHWRLAAAGQVVPTRVEKVCRWDGTAPGCNGSCSGGWSQEARARREAEANRITWIHPAGGMPKFGEACLPFTSKALCCRFQEVR
jgi:hypothetical protein